jgi:hypothetical protein
MSEFAEYDALRRFVKAAHPSPLDELDDLVPSEPFFAAKRAFLLGYARRAQRSLAPTEPRHRTLQRVN